MDALLELTGSQGGVYELLILPGEYLLGRLAVLAPDLYASLTHAAGEVPTMTVAAVAATAWLLSALLVYILLRVTAKLLSAVRDALVSLRYAAMDAGSELKVRAICQLKAIARRRSAGIVVQEERGLGELEMAVLSVGSKLPPGFTLSVVDLANRLRRRPSEVLRGLENLHQHQFVNPALGSSEGYGTYSLTDSGAWYIAVHEQRKVTGARA